MNIFDLIKTTKDKRYLSEIKEWIESNSYRIRTEQSEMSIGVNGGSAFNVTLSVTVDSSMYHINAKLNYLRENQVLFNIKYQNCIIKNLIITQVNYKTEQPYVVTFMGQRGMRTASAEITYTIILEADMYLQSAKEASTTIDITKEENLRERRVW